MSIFSTKNYEAAKMTKKIPVRYESTIAMLQKTICKIE